MARLRKRFRHNNGTRCPKCKLSAVDRSRNRARSGLAPVALLTLPVRHLGYQPPLLQLFNQVTASIKISMYITTAPLPVHDFSPMRKRHRIKCQNQEYQRLKQDFASFQGARRSIFHASFSRWSKSGHAGDAHRPARTQSVQGDAKTAPKARQWHFALLKLLLSSRNLLSRIPRAEMRLDCFEPMHQSGYHAGGYENISSLRSRKSFCFTDHHHLAFKGMPRNSRLTRGLFSI